MLLPSGTANVPQRSLMWKGGSRECSSLPSGLVSAPTSQCCSWRWHSRAPPAVRTAGCSRTGGRRPAIRALTRGRSGGGPYTERRRGRRAAFASRLSWRHGDTRRMTLGHGRTRRATAVTVLLAGIAAIGLIRFAAGLGTATRAVGASPPARPECSSLVATAPALREAMSRAAPGDVVCLTARRIDLRNGLYITRSGSPTKWITITSFNQRRPSTISVAPTCSGVPRQADRGRRLHPLPFTALPQCGPRPERRPLHRPQPPCRLRMESRRGVRLVGVRQ